LEKKKTPMRVLSSHWSPDGQFIAYTSFQGKCNIRDQEFNSVIEIDHAKQVFSLS